MPKAISNVGSNLSLFVELLGGDTETDTTMISITSLSFPSGNITEIIRPGEQQLITLEELVSDYAADATPDDRIWLSNRLKLLAEEIL